MKPPLCKGRWHGQSRDGGIANSAFGKMTIPQSAFGCQPPLHKGAFSFLQMQHVDAERRGEEPRKIGAQRRGDGVARFAHARRAKVDGENVKRRLR